MQDQSTNVVVINFLVGVIIMLTSARVSELAGIPFSRRPQEAARVTRIAYVSALSLGAAIASVMAAIYILFHLLRIGV